MGALAARAVFEDATSIETVAELFPAGTLSEHSFARLCLRRSRST
jgi:hypothetical protein